MTTLEWRAWATYMVCNENGLVMNQHGKVITPFLDTRTGYEQVNVYVGGQQFCMRLHRLVAIAFLPNPLELPCVDHIDGDMLNNDAANLRWATMRQNQYNRRSSRGSTSRHKGVCWNAGRGKWYATITVRGVKVYLGSFLEEDAAGYAYDAAARLLHGAFVRLNLPLAD